MRISLSLVAVPLLVGVVTGQSTTTNEFTIFPDSRDATSRGAVPGGSIGDILIEVRGLSYNPFSPLGAPLGNDAFSSVGDQNNFNPAMGGSGAGTVAGFTGRHQDQNGSTTEQFDFVLVVEDTIAGQPAPPPIGNPFGPEVLLRTSALTTLPGLSTPAVFITNALLATPADVIPTSDTWYYGSGISSNALWANDGISIPMGTFNGLGSPFPNEGDNPLDPGGPSNYSWGRDITSGTNAQSADARVHNLGILVFSPVVNWGADIAAPGILAMGAAPNPNFGVAGIHPDAAGVGNATRVAAYSGAPVLYAGRSGMGDGLSLRTRAVQAIGNAGSIYLLTGLLNFAGPPIYLNNPGFLGSIGIDLTVTIPFPIASGGAFPASGETVDVLVPQGGGAGPLSTFTPGVLSIQGLLIDSIGRIHLSNAAKTNF